MKKDKTLAILGTGGHARPVLEVLNENYQKVNKELYDLNFKKNKKEKILGAKVIGSFDKYLKTKKKITFLAIGDNKIRGKVYNILKKKKIRIPNLISITSSISKYLKIGDSNFINKKAFIGTLVKIGNNNIINSGALIEHEVVMGNNNHIAPKSIIGGRVRIGNNVLIGLGCKILPGIKLCSNTIIGAGSVVTKNILTPATYVGIPAKIIKRKAKKLTKKKIK